MSIVNLIFFKKHMQSYSNMTGLILKIQKFPPLEFIFLHNYIKLWNMKRNLTVGISYEATYPATIRVSYSDIKLQHANSGEPIDVFMRIFGKLIIGSQYRIVMQCNARGQSVHFVITELCCEVGGDGHHRPSVSV